MVDFLIENVKTPDTAKLSVVVDSLIEHVKIKRKNAIGKPSQSVINSITFRIRMMLRGVACCSACVHGHIFGIPLFVLQRRFPESTAFRASHKGSRPMVIGLWALAPISFCDHGVLGSWAHQFDLHLVVRSEPVVPWAHRPVRPTRALSPWS